MQCQGFGELEIGVELGLDHDGEAVGKRSAQAEEHLVVGADAKALDVEPVLLARQPDEGIEKLVLP